MPHITAGICTKDRYDLLPMALLSVINQERTPDALILYDDSSKPKDLRQIQTYQYIFDLMTSKKIAWHVEFGQKKGQHLGHQFVQTRAKDLVYRIDDDEVAEPNVLKILESHFVNKPGKRAVGAVGGLVIPPNAPYRECLPNTIESIDRGNCQWFRWAGVKEVEHLYSSYLYKKGIQEFERDLSPVAHREETLHSYGIFKKSYRLLVDGAAVTYHFRSGTGGIREGAKQEYWDLDEKLFRERMREYGNGVPKKEKAIVCDFGMGDTIIFKRILPEIKEKYRDYKIILYVCYPEILKDEGLEMRSIADAYARLGNIDRHNVYKYCIDTKHSSYVINAFREFYKL